jgi:serine phosphatase RsbU (regulator of sigma subunit)
MAQPSRLGGWIRPRPISLVVTAVIAAITAALVVIAHVSADHTQSRLLRLKVAEAGTLLQAALPSVQTPLTAAAEFASGPAAQAAPAFRRYIGAYVGRQPKPFVSASLWALPPAGPAHLLTTVGEAPLLRPGDASTTAFFARIAKAAGLGVTDVLGGTPRHIGYAYVTAGPHPAYAVYVESALPEAGRVRTPSGTAFSDLRFRLYLGTSETSANFLEANNSGLTGSTARVTVPFGNTALLLVAAADGPLAGSLASALWWILALAGGALAIAAGGVTQRLVTRRRAAESLAGEVQELLARQRVIADTLQRAVVPAVPAAIAGVDLEARYLTGAGDVDVGGDWYDAIRVAQRRLFVVVGDVSGRGIEASTTMASLRSAVRAFVSEGHQPADVLARLNRLNGVSVPGKFATVLCAVLDDDRQTITVASAGHPPPLVIGSDGAQYVRVVPGPPIGISAGSAYQERSQPLHTGDTVLLFTDGVVERRGESIETGLQRLADAASAAPRGLGALLDSLAQPRAEDGGTDDSALMAVRWIER